MYVGVCPSYARWRGWWVGKNEAGIVNVIGSFTARNAGIAGTNVSIWVRPPRKLRALGPADLDLPKISLQILLRPGCPGAPSHNKVVQAAANWQRVRLPSVKRVLEKKENRK